ncbi:hypothetical protein BKA93DRAFT_746073 [Sparassis latifolia]
MEKLEDIAHVPMERTIPHRPHSRVQFQEPPTDEENRESRRARQRGKRPAKLRQTESVAASLSTNPEIQMTIEDPPAGPGRQRARDKSLVKKWEEWTEAALQRTLRTAEEGLVRELNARSRACTSSPTEVIRDRQGAEGNREDQDRDKPDRTRQKGGRKQESATTQGARAMWAAWKMCARCEANELAAEKTEKHKKTETYFIGINDAGATTGAPQNEAELELQDLAPRSRRPGRFYAPPCLSQSHFEALITGLTVLPDTTPQTPGSNTPNSDDSRYMKPAPDLPITYAKDARPLGSPPLPFSNLSPAAMTCRDNFPARVPPQEREYAMHMSSYTESCLDIPPLPEHPILGNLTRDTHGKSIYDLLSDAVSQYTQYRQYNMFLSVCLSSPATIVYAPMQTRYGPARPCVQMMAMQAESCPDGMDRASIRYGLVVSFFFGSDAHPPGSFFPAPIIGELFPSPSTGPRFSDDLAGAVGMVCEGPEMRSRATKRRRLMDIVTRPVPMTVLAPVPWIDVQGNNAAVSVRDALPVEIHLVVTRPVEYSTHVRDFDSDCIASSQTQRPQNAESEENTSNDVSVGTELEPLADTRFMLITPPPTPVSVTPESSNASSSKDPHSPTTVPAVPARSPTLAAAPIVPAITPAASLTVAALNSTQLAVVTDRHTALPLPRNVKKNVSMSPPSTVSSPLYSPTGRAALDLAIKELLVMPDHVLNQPACRLSRSPDTTTPVPLPPILPVKDLLYPPSPSSDIISPATMIEHQETTEDAEMTDSDTSEMISKAEWIVAVAPENKSYVLAPYLGVHRDMIQLKNEPYVRTKLYAPPFSFDQTNDFRRMSMVTFHAVMSRANIDGLEDSKETKDPFAMRIATMVRQRRDYSALWYSHIGNPFLWPEERLALAEARALFELYPTTDAQCQDLNDTRVILDIIDIMLGYDIECGYAHDIHRHHRQGLFGKPGELPPPVPSLAAGSCT